MDDLDNVLFNKSSLGKSNKKYCVKTYKDLSVNGDTSYLCTVKKYYVKDVCYYTYTLLRRDSSVKGFGVSFIFEYDEDTYGDLDVGGGFYGVSDVSEWAKLVGITYYDVKNDVYMTNTKDIASFVFSTLSIHLVKSFKLGLKDVLEDYIDKFDDYRFEVGVWDDYKSYAKFSLYSDDVSLCEELESQFRRITARTKSFSFGEDNSEAFIFYMNF